MDTLYTVATSTFSTVVGFSVQNIADWFTGYVIRLFVGIPLTLLVKGIGWIVAGLVIGGIIYFVASLMHFFRH